MKASTKETGYQSEAIDASQIHDPVSMMAKLKCGAETVVVHLLALFSAEFCAALAQWKSNRKTLPGGFLQQLVSALNELIAGPPLWDAEAFAAVRLRDETRDLLKVQPTAHAQQNLALLEDVFPRNLPGTRTCITLDPEIGSDGSKVSIYMELPAKGGERFRTSYSQRGIGRMRETFSSEAAARDHAKSILGDLDYRIVKTQGLSIVELREKAEQFDRLTERASENGLDLLQCINQTIGLKAILGNLSPFAAADHYKDYRQSFRPQLISVLQRKHVKRKTDLKKTSNHVYKLEYYSDKVIREFGDIEIHKLNADDCLDLVLNEYDDPRTRLEMARIINSLINVANEWKAFPRFSDLPLIPVKDLGKRILEIKIISPADYSVMLNGLKKPEHLLTAVQRGLIGVRNSESEVIEWPDYCFFEDKPSLFVRAEVEKGEEGFRYGRNVDLPDAAIAWLAPFVQSEGQLTPAQNPGENLRDASKRLGIDWKYNFLRHAFVSYLLAVTKNHSYVASQAGHSERMQQKHYNRPVQRSIGEAFFDIKPDWPTHPLFETCKKVRDFCTCDGHLDPLAYIRDRLKQSPS